MNKLFKILGILAIVFAAGIGFFADFPNATIVELALAAFGLTSLVITSVKEAKEKGNLNWKTITVMVLAVVAGVLCCLGGLSQNIFAEITAAILALLVLIYGLLFNK